MTDGDTSSTPGSHAGIIVLLIILLLSVAAILTFGILTFKKVDHIERMLQEAPAPPVIPRLDVDSMTLQPPLGRTQMVWIATEQNPEEKGFAKNVNVAVHDTESPLDGLTLQVTRVTKKGLEVSLPRAVSVTAQQLSGVSGGYVTEASQVAGVSPPPEAE
jgi:hypothetical protein